MSRFADSADVVTKAIGECECPGTPHAQDECVMHRQLGHGALGEVNNAGWIAGRGVVFDSMAAQRKLVELTLVSWNLLGPDGKPVEPNELSIVRLDAATVERLATLANEALAKDPLPNESGAPSAGSSPESASPTPESPSPPTSTTT